MKTQIQTPYGKTYFDGTKKETVDFLRLEALEKREYSRQAHKLPCDVYSLPSEKHQSRLVTMASFEINRKGINDLIDLLNAHGVVKYSLL